MVGSLHLGSLLVGRRLWSTRRLAALAMVALAALITAGTLGYASSQVIRVLLPEQPVPPGGINNVMPLPDVPLLPGVRYRAMDPAEAAQESGLPVAYLSSVPADLQGSVGTEVTPQNPALPTNTDVVLHVDSLVRYSGDGHTMILELSKPSSSFIANYEVYLGDHTVHLTNGQPAWTSVFPQSFQPNVVAFVSGPYIVAAASDLPFDQLEQIASGVTVSPEASHPAGIPSAEPLHSSRNRLPGGGCRPRPVDHFVCRRSGQPRLQFDIQIGNRHRTGPERNIATVLPGRPGLSRSQAVRSRHHPFWRRKWRDGGHGKHRSDGFKRLQ